MSLLDQTFTDPAFIAGFFTIAGGIALKLVEKWLSRGAEKIDLKKDYREEIKDLSDRLDKEEEETVVWRQKYFTAEEDNHRLRVKMIKGGLDPDN